MSYITTYTGKHFDPICPDPDLIDIVDIAHALPLLCRANGQLKYFFSVAQHSLNCCHEAEKRGYSPKVQLACLLHDAAEAYVCDITRPLKAGMPEYCRTEDCLLNVIWEKYIRETVSEEDRAQVFAIDDDMLSYEFWKLMPEKIDDRYRRIQSEPDLECRNPMEVEKEFWKVFEQLKDGIECNMGSSF